jgi:hypothetical protein
VDKIKPEWLTALFTAVIAATGIWALTYAKGQIDEVRREAQEQIREARAEAQVQHLVTLDTEYNNEPMLTYRKLAAQKRLAGQKDPKEEDDVLDFFESVALLANRGYLTDEDVYTRFAYGILSTYADDKESIEEERKYDTTNLSNLEALIPRLEAIDAAQHGTLANPTKDDLADFWKNEAGLGVGTPSGHKQTSAK